MDIFSKIDFMNKERKMIIVCAIYSKIKIKLPLF